MEAKIKDLFLNLETPLTSFEEDSSGVFKVTFDKSSFQLKMVSVQPASSLFIYKLVSNSLKIINRFEEEILDSIKSLNFCNHDVKKMFSITKYIMVADNATLCYSFNSFNLLNLPLNFLNQNFKKINFAVKIKDKKTYFETAHKSFNSFESLLVYLYRQEIKEVFPEANFDNTEGLIDILKLIKY